MPSFTKGLKRAPLPKEDKPTWTQVVMLLEGISLKTVKYRRRYAIKR